MPGPNVVVIPDWMPDIKAWLKAHPTLSPLHGGRVFFRIPTKQAQWPLLRIYQAGGAIEAYGGDFNTSVVSVSIEAWSNGPPDRPNFDYQSVRQLVTALQSILHTMPSGTLLNPAGGPTVALNAHATTVIDSPDPESGWPRLVCDTQWVIQGL